MPGLRDPAAFVWDSKQAGVLAAATSGESADALRRTLLSTGVVHVFLSSPFLGMEAERQELVEKYVPGLHKMCESAGEGAAVALGPVFAVSTMGLV